MANKGLTNITVTKSWRDGRAYFERYVDALRNAIGNVSSITNLNLVQIAKDISPNYSFTNNGTASLSKSLQDQINDIQAGGVPITGTTSNDFTIRSASNYLKLNAATLTIPVTLTSPNESGEIVLKDATQTLTNKTFTNSILINPTLGTPSSGTLTNCINLPISTGISGLGTGVATFLATPSSANLASTVTDETGSGALVFGTSPTIVSPNFKYSQKWTSAQLVGSGFVIGTTFPAIAALNSTDIAFIESGVDELRTYRFNGSTWSLVGSGLAIATVGTPALAALNSTDVAFIDATNDSLRTYRFNGSTWSLVGSGLAISSVGGPAIAALNGTDIAFIDEFNDSLRTYRFNGSTWSLVGSGLAISSVSNPALAALNSTDVAFIDSNNHELRTYRFNGSTWSLVGSGLAISSATTSAIAALNGTDIAFIDEFNDSLRTYRFNGSTWSLVGSGLAISSVSNPAIAALNGTDIAFIDGTNDELRTYRFGFSIESPYSVSGGAF